MKLTDYGKRRLGYIYKQYKDNTSFESLEEFIDYALNHGYKDWYEINLEIKSKGLVDGNIEFRRAKNHVRADRLGLVGSDKISYGYKVNLIKEMIVDLSEMSMKCDEILFNIDFLERQNFENLDIIRAYLRNEKSNINRVLEEIDKLDIKQ